MIFNNTITSYNYTYMVIIIFKCKTLFDTQLLTSQILKYTNTENYVDFDAINVLSNMNVKFNYPTH